jgi:Xaa-Pro aminopeptidase
MSNVIASRLAALRTAMEQKKYDAYLIPSSDPHQSEYVATHYLSRTWISGFTGSMANAIVTKNHAGLWTDVRYFIQAEQELANSEVELHKMLVQASSEHTEWLANTMPENSTVGCDGMLFTVGQVRAMQKLFKAKNIQLEYTEDLISEVWTSERPKLPQSSIFEHDVAYAGKTRQEKINAIREKMTAQKADFHLVSTLDDIAWMYNLRGTDVECNPVFYAYAVIGQEQSYLFINGKKVNAALRNRLENEGVIVKTYDEISSFLAKIPADKSILLDIHTTSIFLFNKIKNAKIIEGDTIPLGLKAIKNETEIQGTRNAMVKDGVALTRAFRWLESTLKKRSVSEVEFSNKLAYFRSKQALYFGESFAAIVGYKGNGAIIHYRPEEGKCANIENGGILLVDSGGQYQDGTTDITRTIALSEPTAEQKTAYTAVLKGHIGLAMLQFPAGTKGVQMDILARIHLWQLGLNYGHGTGHGVGCFMNVHEPPQGINTGAGTRGSTVHEVGMLTSNEPGYYKTNEFGIRIENLVIVQNSVLKENIQYYSFETVTYFPIDTQLIDKKALSPAEKKWFNDYHQMTFEKLAPHLSSAEKTWLQRKCKAI